MAAAAPSAIEREIADPALGSSGAAGPEAYAHFLGATGHRLLRGAGSYWYEVSRGFFLSLPSHQLLDPSPEALRDLLRHQPCAGLRYPAPLDGLGKLSYQIVCDTPDYGIETLGANARSKVRRGLRRCEIGPVSFATIAAEGLTADRQTLARQGRDVRVAEADWQRFWSAAAAAPGMEGWAAYVGGEMAAFLVSMDFGGTVELFLARSRSDCLDAYPNNALVFEITRTMLVERGMRQVTFGLEALEPVGPLDHFKFGMGFRAAPLRQRVVFHPALRALLHRGAIRAALCRQAERRAAGSGFWRKALGLIRFAEAGGELDPPPGRTA